MSEQGADHAPRRVDRWPLVDRFRTTFHRRVDVIARDEWDGGHEPVRPKSRSVRVAQLTAGDIATYVAFRQTSGQRGSATGATAATFLRRLQRDWRCSAVRSDGTIVHVAWIAFERAHVEYLDRDLLLAPDEAFWFDAYTHPDWRRTDVSAVRSEHDRRYLRARGCRRSLAIVARENAIGAAYTSALGFRRIGSYQYWRLGPLSRWRGEAIDGESLPPLVAPL